MFGPLPIRILAGIAFFVAGIPKLENITINQGFFGGLGLPPELVLPIALLEVVGGIFLIAGVLTSSRLSRRTTTQTGCNDNKFAVNGSISLLLTGPGRLSIEWNVLRREVFPRGNNII
jgi:putative oxidoreductase